MRVQNGVGYPDAIAYAFMPMMVVSDSDSILALEVTLTGEDGSAVTARQDALGGRCYMDVSDYVQGLMGDVVALPQTYASVTRSDAVQKVIFEVKKKTSSGWTVAISNAEVWCVWGGLDRGETWGCHRCPTWWPSLPCCVDLWNEGSRTFTFRGDGGATANVTPSTAGLWHVPIPSVLSGSKTISVTDGIGEVVIMVDGCSAASLLRFVGRHGIVAHMMALSGSEGLKTASSGEYRRNNIYSWVQQGGWTGLSGDGRTRTRNRKMKLAMIDVTQEEWPMVADVVSSPIVEIYEGGIWKKVLVETDELTRSSAPLQDVEIEIGFEETPTQNA